MTESLTELVAAQRKFLMADMPPVIGHRGAALDAPENTLASIREAKRQGARWVEVDVKISSDASAYLMHDDSLDRTTDGHGPSSEMSAADLMALDAGRWFDERFAGERLPPLTDLFALLDQENMAVNLEIKPNPGAEEATTEAIVLAIEQSWPRLRPRPLLSSFKLKSLAKARDLAPSIPRGLLVEEPGSDCLALLDDLACASLHVSSEHCDLKWLADIAAMGIPVLIYTVNDPMRALELLDAGAHSIITDRPQAIIETLLPLSDG